MAGPFIPCSGQRPGQPACTGRTLLAASAIDSTPCSRRVEKFSSRTDRESKSRTMQIDHSAASQDAPCRIAQRFAVSSIEIVFEDAARRAGCDQRIGSSPPIRTTQRATTPIKAPMNMPAMRVTIAFPAKRRPCTRLPCISKMHRQRGETLVDRIFLDDASNK
jgi:hypothetical protein